MQTVVDESGGEYRVSLRRREWGSSALFAVWLMAWTVGCIVLAYAVFAERNWFTLLFALPFWSSWIVMFMLICKQLFQREELILGLEGVKLKKSIFPYKFSVVSKGWDEIKTFQIYQWAADGENKQSSRCIELQTLGQPIYCFERVSEQELNWLIHQLNQQLLTWRRPGQSPPRTIEMALSAREETASDPNKLFGDGEVLSLDQGAPVRPSDCKWVESEDFDQFSFHRRGRFSLVGFFGMLFINAFWNGIVGVFVALLWGFAPDQKPPEGLAWWGMFAFLIPFEVVGAVMILGLFAVLFEPLHRTRWTFSRDHIDLRHSWLGVGRGWTWPAEKLERIELRRDRPTAPKPRSSHKERPPESPIPTQFRLRFMVKENREVCSIANLNEGEARWIGQIVLRKRNIWFR